MSKNVGPTDRVIRLTVGTALLMLAIFGPWGAVVGWILGILGVVMLVVGVTMVCPIYAMLGISSCPKERDPRSFPDGPQR